MRLFKKIIGWMNCLLKDMIIVFIQRIGNFARASSEQNLKDTVDSILVIRLDEIGDMVMLSPFLRELRRNNPRAHITLVVKPEVYNLVERCPYVNEVLSFSRKGGGVRRRGR